PAGVRSDKDGLVIEWDPAFAYASIQLGLGVEVRARRGADRGPGTNLGNWVKHFFFKARGFVNEADIEKQLSEWLREHHARTPTGGAAGPQRAHADGAVRQDARHPAGRGAPAPAFAQGRAARPGAAVSGG